MPVDPSAFLSGKPTGTHVPEVIKMRVRGIIEEPKTSGLSCMTFDALTELIPTLSGTFLDVGCYGGWVYPFVKDVVEYHGIDNWHESIVAGKEMFGDELFSYDSVTSCLRTADTVWATLLHPEVKVENILPNLVKMANKQVIFTCSGGFDESLFKEVKQLASTKHHIVHCGTVPDVS